MSFTIVFEGDITKLPFNPLKTETVYGKPIASGMGNAFDVIEKIYEIEDAATKLLQVIERNFEIDSPDECGFAFSANGLGQD